MRYFVLLVFPLLMACNPDTAGAGTQITGTIANNGKLQENPTASARANSGQALVLRMGQATAPTGATVCLPVAASEFQNLIGFQFTMQWDSTQLEYQKVTGFKLPGYGPTNFGDRFVSRGYLSTLWTEATLQGKSVPNGTNLFEICFKNLAPAGTESVVRFTDGPTTFEVIAADMSQWKLRFANGLVRSE